MTQTATEQSTLPLENVSQSGKAPKSRIGSASNAQQLVSRIVQGNRERSRWNAKIKGQLDGNPPFNPEKLKAAGQNYRTNLNFLEAKASLSAALVPYYDLFAGATNYFQVRTSYGTADDREYYSGCITEEFDRLLKRWSGFDFNIHRMLYDFIGFGKGFEMWPDKTSWRFQCIPHFKVLVPDGADACVENLELLIIRERIQCSKLWGYIKDKKAAMAIGWDIQATCNAIANADPERQTGTNQYNFEFVEQMMKDKDLYEGTRLSTVAIAHVYVREFSTKVSHYIVPESVLPTSGATNTSSQMPIEYLFDGHEQFDSFSQILAAFFYETLDGSWNGASGLGRDIFAPMAVKDRLKCSALDLTFLRTGISLQANNASSLQKAALVQAGVFNIIPDGYSVQQSTILGDVKSPIEADMYLDNVLSNNTGVYRQRQMKVQGNPITAKQAEIDQMNSVVLTNSAVNRFYCALDKLGTEMFRRATTETSDDSEQGKDAKEFIRRVLEKGVPKEALQKIESVHAYRNVGNGSIYMRQQSLNQLMPFVSMFPENGRQNFVEDVVAANAGHSMVERYAPRQEKAKLPNDHMEIALLENAALKSGSPVTWTPTQNNVIHAQTHLQAAAGASSNIQQIPPDKLPELWLFIDAIGKHVAIHLQQLANDPTRATAYKALTEQWKQLAKISDELRKRIQANGEATAERNAAMQQAQAIQQGTDPDTMIKAAETQAKIQMQQQKTNAAIAMKQQKHNQNMALADATTAAKISKE